MMGPQFRLPLCTYYYDLARLGNAVHKRLPQLTENYVHTMEHLNESSILEANNLMHVYVKRGSMVDAWHVFENMAKRNVVSWNIMILGYAKQEEAALALALYAQMSQANVQPSDRTFVGALKACSSAAAIEDGKLVDGPFVKSGCLAKGRAIHFHLVKSGFESNVFVGTTLVDMYAKCGSLDDAQSVFDRLPHRDVVCWNAMILGHSKQEEAVLALNLYARMHQEGVSPDDRTFVGTLNACSSLAASDKSKQMDGDFSEIYCLERGRAIHSRVIKSGYEADVFVGTTLVDMYAKCGIMEDARRVFVELPRHDVVTWTTMILGYSKKEEGAVALDLYAQMREEGLTPDHQTFVGVLNACSAVAALQDGKQIDVNSVNIGCLEKGRIVHSHIVKSGFESDVFVGTTLLDMYAKCGCTEDARHVFDGLPYRNVVTWTTMILGYAEQEDSEEAFNLYARMEEEGLSPNSFTFVAILKACGSISALKIGKELHSQITRVGIETIAIVATSLIDMYAKCGSMGDARKLFDATSARDVISWNALIAGYARQGESVFVFQLFERMSQEGVQPNDVTLLSVLTVCSHAGLFDKGQKHLEAMSKQYAITPTIEHYTCMIDLLGRAGQLDRAVAMVEKMPFQPNVVVWLTVLGACRKWKNVQVGRHAFENAVRLDRKLPTAYVLMTNIYADAHMQEDLEKIQVMRKNLEALDTPRQGLSTDVAACVG